MRLNIGDGVWEYLARFPDMVGVALEAIQAAERVFPGAEPISLGVYHDPEIEDSYLLLRVPARQYNDAYLPGKIEEVENSYLGLLDGLGGWLQFGFYFPD